MRTLQVYISKSIRTIRESGLRVFFKKVIMHYSALKKNRAEYRTVDASHIYADVLFVNGCFLPHPSRYRVSHQKEQLYANGMVSSEVFYENLTLNLVKHYRLFIFFRCPITDVVRDFIKLAKKHNKTVLFDIDDLVIDSKYTDAIPYLDTMEDWERKLYDRGVLRMQETLRMCDGAITTTEALANELKNYVKEVFVNRNTVSQEMLSLSMGSIQFRDIVPNTPPSELKSKPRAVRKFISYAQKCTKMREGRVRIGYFSGSITHNDDFKTILPVIVRIMSECDNTELHIVGDLDIPEELNQFRARIYAKPFTDWRNLPSLIASVDINLAPLADTLFNAAKSENKWLEAAIVKVPTVASSVGAMKQMIEHNRTALLCENVDDWYRELLRLVTDNELRKTIAENAYKYVTKHCTTIYNGKKFTDYIKSKLTPNIAFVLPSIKISGGVLVILKHCLVLQKAGYDVLILNDDIDSNDIKFESQEIFVLSRISTGIHGSFDKCVASLWTTVSFLNMYPNITNKYYLVQSFETDFYEHGHRCKILANATYSPVIDLKYITISKWCKKWLNDDYHIDAKYAPNGIHIKQFYPQKRNFFIPKIRILIEGNSEDYHKNVDESFKIIELLDRSKYEVWYLSYLGEPKEWYDFDKFLHKVSYHEVANVYRQCHILLKSSILESFSYPPLEMMATGGIAVVASNTGNAEYLKDKENCLLYKSGDIEYAAQLINDVVLNKNLQEQLYVGGIHTANSRDWQLIIEDILELYEVRRTQ